MYIPNKFKNKIISFDFDGTLNDGDKNPDLGVVPEKTKRLISNLKEQGYMILAHTSRDSLFVTDIRKLTGIEDVHSGKPIADLYIDDKGLFPGADIELTEAFIEQYFHTQEEYLNLLVAGKLKSAYLENISNVPENPDYQEADNSPFKVYIPVTGGMDSLTLWQMAIESGYPVCPIYIDAGQEYASLEIEKASEIVEEAGYSLEVINVNMPFKRYKHILLGRNAVVIYIIAELMKQRGEWGEIWLGNLAGESPILGGDKSRRFLNDTQRLLTYKGYDIRLETPLIGIDKPDEVAYWKERDINVLINTKSCFSENLNQCGECQTCFRKWVAFQANDLDIRSTFNNANIKESFKPFIDKYRKVMNKALDENDFSHYSPSRIKTTLKAIEKI